VDAQADRLRYLGAGIDLTTFTDDIILDQSAPTVQSAQLLKPNVAARKPKARTATAKRHAYAIKLRANDTIVGVCTVQISLKRSGGTTLNLVNCHKRGILRIMRTLHVSSPQKPKYLRVKNSAGSWSRWKKLA